MVTTKKDLFVEIYDVVKPDGISESMWKDESSERHDVVREEFDDFCLCRLTKRLVLWGKVRSLPVKVSSLIFRRIIRIMHIWKNGIRKAFAPAILYYRRKGRWIVTFGLRHTGRVLVLSRGVSPRTTAVSSFIQV